MIIYSIYRMKDIVGKVKNYVKKECRKPTSCYGFDPFQYHFIPMVKYAEMLACEFKADKEIVLISAWLHDIGSIMFGRKDHHLTGSRVARELLTRFDYPSERINLIEKCITNHRSSTASKRVTLEEKIIAEADALSNFDNIPGIFKAAYIYENLSQGEAKVSVRNKLERKYDQLYFEKSKLIIKPKFDAAMLLLS